MIFVILKSNIIFKYALTSYVFLINHFYKMSKDNIYIRIAYHLHGPLCGVALNLFFLCMNCDNFNIKIFRARDFHESFWNQLIFFFNELIYGFLDNILIWNSLNMFGIKMNLFVLFLSELIDQLFCRYQLLRSPHSYMSHLSFSQKEHSYFDRLYHIF